MEIITDSFDGTSEPVTELRVHGVGGASPTSLLGVPTVGLVAGTLRAGFYRPPKWIDVPGPKRNLEAYSWGGLTSRSLGRALWAVLLPFALLNLAGWMFPIRGTATHPKDRGLYENFMLGMFRVLALSASALTAVFTALVFVDIVGVRCVAASGCTEPWYLGPYRWFDTVNGVAQHNVLRGAAVGAVVACVGLLGLAYLTKRGQAHLDDVDDRRRDDPAYRERIATSPDDPDAFWHRADVAHRLGLAHITTALIVVALVLVNTVDTFSEPSLAMWIVGAGLLALLIVEMALVARLSSASGRTHLRLFWAGVVLVAGMITIVWMAPTATADPTIPAFRTTTTIAVGLVITLLLLTSFADTVRSATGVLQRRLTNRDIPEVAKRRMETVETPERFTQDEQQTLPTRLAVAVLGFGIIVAFASAFMVRIAGLLGVEFRTDLVAWFSFYAAAWVVGVLFSAATVFLWRRRTADSRTARAIAADYPNGTIDSTAKADARWLRRTSTAEAAAKVTDSLGTIMSSALLIPLLVAGVLLAASGLREWALTWLVPPATWAMSLLPILAIWAVERLVRSPRARRGFGAIWDVVTFWPRWFHPWAPPSYGEYVVPHLTQRIEALAKTDHVIVSAHSQGTVLALASLHRLDDSTLSRVHLITHGCPLHRLYERYFPEYFDQDLFAQMSRRIAGGRAGTAWHNLHRYTDYIGGPVFTSNLDRAVDIRVCDPAESERDLPIDPRPALLRHSNYFVTEPYTRALRECSHLTRHVLDLRAEHAEV